MSDSKESKAEATLSFRPWPWRPHTIISAFSCAEGTTREHEYQEVGINTVILESDGLFRWAAEAGGEECLSSFVVEAMGELDVWGAVTW